MPIAVKTDAFKVAIDAVLKQDLPDGTNPVAYISKTVNPAEQDYAPQNSEMLGIFYAVTAWRCYLHGHKFTVQTDHAPLKYFFTQDKLTPLQVRWLEKLTPLNFSIIPIKVKADRVADGLFKRASNRKADEEYPKQLMEKFIKEKFHVSNISTIHASESATNAIKEGYSKDPEFQRIFIKPTLLFTKKEGLIYFKDKLFIPNIPLRNDLLHDFHTIAYMGHLGETNTRRRLSNLYYWKNLRKDINKYVTGCRTCQQTKSNNKKLYGLLQLKEPPTTK